MNVCGPVAILTAGELFGGVERHVLELAVYLHAQGLQPQIIVFHDGELARQGREAGLPVLQLATRGSWDLQGPRRLDAMLAAMGARLVHVHGYRAAVNAAATPTVRPLVLTVHGQGEPSWREPVTWLKDRLYRASEVIGCRRRHAVVCFVTDDLRRRHGRDFPGLTRLTIHNGVGDLSGGDAVASPRTELRAVAVGRLTTVKGLQHAIAAMALLPAGQPWVLDLLGDGELRVPLAELARRSGVADRVRFLGFQRDVIAQVATADVFLMPSLHEGLPYALLEAMALGRPVIASNVGGLAEVLRDGETALLVPPGDPAALAQALGALGDDPERRAALGRAARRAQQEKYTLEAMGAAYVLAYGLALAETSQRGT